MLYRARPHRPSPQPILSWPKPWSALIPGIEVRRKVRDRLRAEPESAEPGDVITIENPVTGAMRRAGSDRARSRTPSSCPTTTCSIRRTSGSAVLQGLLDSDGGPVTQERTDLPHPVHDDVRPPARRRHRSWCGRSAASPTCARGRRKGGSRGWRTVATSITATTRTSSTSGSPRASQPFRLARKAAKYDADRRRPADAVHRPHRAGRAPRKRCASRSRPRTRCTSPRTSCSRTTPSTTRSSSSTRRRTPPPSR